MQSIQPITQAIWADKYRYGAEANIEETMLRVADGVYARDTNPDAKREMIPFLANRSVVPAGRISAGAGTPKRVTLINCFVSPKIQDSMETIPRLAGRGIMDTLKVASLTQQMGGGIGMGFGTIRPKGAIVKRTASVSSGVLPFMDMWHSMCGTVKSSGSRRGAMMATLPIWHPDILDYIVAKQTKGRLTNFNVSVLVTDEFMQCLERDGAWDLYFTVPRADGKHVDEYQVAVGEDDGFSEAQVETRYVYQRILARELWDKIIQGTYIYAEPGVIFIDRVNQWNNLQYCEVIEATNPCGEQPLPPDGDCNLGHANLAVMVKAPFTPQATFDYAQLYDTITHLVRFLDNVLDVSDFPTEEQRLEAQSKRREGIGFTGLANALQQLRVAYGSPIAIEITKKITRTMRDAAYRASVELAKERGPFPLFDADKYLATPFIKTLPRDIQDGIRKHGIRNAVLLSLAPVGTMSLVVDNVSSGIEPVFLYVTNRKVLNADSVSYDHYTVYDCGYLAYQRFVVPGWMPGDPPAELPSYFVTSQDLTVDQHLAMQAAAQEYIDASISKTINCPNDMTLDAFKEVYSKAYALGLKGCTTYRYDPRSERGEVLSAPKPIVVPAQIPQKLPMLEIADARRYRVKWPKSDSAFYVVITNYVDELGQARPFELFLMSKSSQHDEWMKALTLLITAIFRRGGDVTFIIEELKQVHAVTGGAFFEQKYVNSLVAAIGLRIEEHCRWLGLLAPDDMQTPSEAAEPRNVVTGETCSACLAPCVIRQEGCKKCTNCGTSDCA